MFCSRGISSQSKQQMESPVRNRDPFWARCASIFVRQFSKPFRACSVFCNKNILNFCKNERILIKVRLANKTKIEKLFGDRPLNAKEASILRLSPIHDPFLLRKRVETTLKISSKERKYNSKATKLCACADEWSCLTINVKYQFRASRGGRQTICETRYRGTRIQQLPIFFPWDMSFFPPFLNSSELLKQFP